MAHLSIDTNGRAQIQFRHAIAFGRRDIDLELFKRILCCHIVRLIGPRHLKGNVIIWQHGFGSR